VIQKANIMPSGDIPRLFEIRRIYGTDVQVTRVLDLEGDQMARGAKA
jgi:hypothetical protein